LNQQSDGRPIDLTRSDLNLPPFWPGMRIGLFGGSFDPAHEGHVAVSLAALRALRLDQVWWLVSPHNPLKPDAPSRDLARRIVAARAIVRDPRIKVTGIEAALGTTYTAETLRRLIPRLRGLKVVWLMGADNLENFHYWSGWQAIAASLPIAVFNRPGGGLKALASPAAGALSAARVSPAAASRLAGMRPPAWVFLPFPNTDMSSTELRAGLRKRTSPRLESVTVSRLSLNVGGSAGSFVKGRSPARKGRTLTTALRSGVTRSRAPRIATARRELAAAAALKVVLHSLEESKAEDLISIDIRGKSTLGDYMVVASGRSQRHVAAIADRLLGDLRDAGQHDVRVEGLRVADWVLIDAGDVIVHVFRPEVRAFYNLEKMWLADHPAGPVAV
jgi:nicotinate-nucleotide adenylyltransferase